MTGNVDCHCILEKYSSVPLASIRYSPNADATLVESIQNGILFFVAFWSGPSLQAFSKLTQAMQQLKLDRFELVVVDVDGALELYQLPQLAVLLDCDNLTAPRGFGEAVYCRDGQMVHAATLGSGSNAKKYSTNAQAFLAACQLK